MSKVHSRRAQGAAPSFGAAVAMARDAREEYFPKWKRRGAALALVAGVGLMVSSVVLMQSTANLSARNSLELVDSLYMSGFVLVLLNLMYLPWVAVHMSAHERAHLTM